MATQTFIDCGVVDVIAGKTVLVTGLEDEPDGALRVYVGARYRKMEAPMLRTRRKDQAAIWAKQLGEILGDMERYFGEPAFQCYPPSMQMATRVAWNFAQAEATAPRDEIDE